MTPYTESWLVWFGLMIIFIIFLTIRYFRKRIRRPIVTQYEPPKKINPMMCGFLIDKKLHMRDIIAGIIFLHQKGIIHFDKKKPKKTLANDKNEKENRYITELAYKKGYFVRLETRWLIFLYSFILAIFIITGFHMMFEIVPHNVGLASMFDLYAYMIGFIPFSIIGILMAQLAKKTYTKKGWELRNQILGFKEYLQKAEKHRLDFHNSIEEEPELFSYYLAYAVAIGINTTWLDRYDSLNIKLSETFVFEIHDALPRVEYERRKLNVTEIIDLVEKHS